jgi:NTP pyrophosphatase (non-canonical NTP hydrolase)
MIDSNMEHFNQLSPAEAERLALLSEELAEAIQAIAKICRHGFESRHPAGGLTNRELLEVELGDVRCALHMMCNAGDLNNVVIYNRAEQKANTVKKYLHHQPV